MYSPREKCADIKVSWMMLWISCRMLIQGFPPATSSLGANSRLEMIGNRMSTMFFFVFFPDVYVTSIFVGRNLVKP